MSDIFLVPGFRTAFVKAGGAFATHTALELSVPVAVKARSRCWNVSDRLASMGRYVNLGGRIDR
jgi:hypothetical protein